jgi:hypothetical protein
MRTRGALRTIGFRIEPSARPDLREAFRDERAASLARGKEPLGLELPIRGEDGVAVYAERVRQLAAPGKSRTRSQPPASGAVGNGAGDAQKNRQRRIAVDCQTKVPGTGSPKWSIYYL